MIALDQDHKVCVRAECHAAGTPQPVTSFYRRAAAPDGLQPYCRTCTREATLTWQRRNPEAYSAQQRRVRLKRRMDPERVGSHRAYNRERRRRVQAIPVERHRGPRGVRLTQSDTLPVSPLTDWLWVEMRARDMSIGAMAWRLGIGDRALRRILYEQDRVELDTVDRLTLALDASIDDVYGDVPNEGESR